MIASDLAAGFGDSLTSGFGMTDLLGLPSGTEAIREALGWNDVVNQGSGSYTAGGLTGDAWGLLAGSGLFARAKGISVVFRRYPNAGGGGMTINSSGMRRFGLDWHRFDLRKGGPTLNLPHYHRGKTKSQMKKHRPWQGGC